MSSLKQLQDLIQEKYKIDPATLDPDASMLDQGVDSLALAELAKTPMYVVRTNPLTAPRQTGVPVQQRFGRA